MAACNEEQPAPWPHSDGLLDSQPGVRLIARIHSRAACPLFPRCSMKKLLLALAAFAFLAAAQAKADDPPKAEKKMKKKKGKKAKKAAAEKKTDTPPPAPK
jgi:hypothetical protein